MAQVPPSETRDNVTSMGQLSSFLIPGAMTALLFSTVSDTQGKMSKHSLKASYPEFSERTPTKRNHPNTESSGKVDKDYA